jgi:hypothetical protein
MQVQQIVFFTARTIRRDGSCTLQISNDGRVIFTLAVSISIIVVTDVTLLRKGVDQVS